jgi:hypothetical protein
MYNLQHKYYNSRPVSYRRSKHGNYSKESPQPPACPQDLHRPYNHKKNALDGVKFGVWTISEQSEQPEAHTAIYIN